VGGLGFPPVPVFSFLPLLSLFPLSFVLSVCLSSFFFLLCVRVTGYLVAFSSAATPLGTPGAHGRYWLCVLPESRAVTRILKTTLSARANPERVRFRCGAFSARWDASCTWGGIAMLTSRRSTTGGITLRTRLEDCQPCRIPILAAGRLLIQFSARCCWLASYEAPSLELML